MEGHERRKTERIMLAIPIRVLSFGGSGGSFAEDTQTIQLNRVGARIALTHRVMPGDSLRVINLQNFAEAEFRVVGPARLDHGRVTEWGVECTEPDRNIWNIQFPPPILADDAQAGALLACQTCGKEELAVLSLVEVDVLDSAGFLQRLCGQCSQYSSWAYSDITRRPQEACEAPLPVAPPPAGRPQQGGLERRLHKRLPLRLPVRIRNQKGEQEVSKTENVSKGGIAVCLGMLLAVGEFVNVVCPYTEGDQSLEQKAEVRRRGVFMAGERWLYGLKYLR
jgi:hypothetical protein